MTTIMRLHTYLNANARVRARDVVHLGIITLYQSTVTDPRDNVILVHEDDAGRLAGPLRQARASVQERGGRAHVRLIEEMFPHLSTALTSLGFREVEREPLLICTPEMLRPASNAPELTVATLTRESPLRDIQQELDINERGFDPGFSGSATAEQAERFRSTLDSARAFTAHLNGKAVAAGMFHTPLDGVTQLSGIATLAAFRRRGIAAALTTFMTQTAFDAGVDLVYLAAANETAQRVYERIGYRQAGMLIRYDDTLTNVPPSND